MGYGYDLELRNAIFGRAGAFLAFRQRRGHLQVRLHGGASGILNRDHTVCVGYGLHVERCRLAGIPSLMPYLGIGLGYAFGPSS